MTRPPSILSQFLNVSEDELRKIAQQDDCAPVRQPEFPSSTPDPVFMAKLLPFDATHHPKVAKMLEWTYWFFRKCLHNDRSKGHTLILAGGTGVGKTAAMRRVYKQVKAWQTESLFRHWKQDHGLCPMWIPWPSVSGYTKQEWEDFMEDVKESSVLFVDEFGAEVDKFKTGEPAERARSFFQECERKWLMMTTNLPSGSYAKQYDARVASRLAAMREFDLSGVPDYRPKLAAGRNSVNQPTEETK